MGILQPIFEHERARIAVSIGATEISYGQLCDDIDTMARWLLGNGLQPGDRIALRIAEKRYPTYWEWIMHLGSVRAGMVHSSGQFGPRSDSSPVFGPEKAVVGDESDWQVDAGSSAIRLQFDQSSLAPLQDRIEAVGAAPLDGLEESAVRLLATSGTMGSIKVAAWDHARMEHRLAQVREMNKLVPSTQLLPLLGFPTTAGFRYPLAVWQAGGCVILRAAGSTIRNAPEDFERSTLIVASPFYLGKILPALSRSLAGREKRIVKLLGGRLTVSLRDQAVERMAARVEVSYGSTETGTIATGDASLVDRDPGAVGYLLPSVEAEVVDGQEQVMPAGREGILRVKSPGMIDSYAYSAQQPGQSSPLRDGWFYPGDIGLFHEDGMLSIVGRIGDRINFAGSKIAAIPVEAAIRELPGVEDACLLSLQMDEGDRLAVAVKCRDEVRLDELRAQIIGTGQVKWKFLLIRVPEIPRNAMGKIMRHLLTQRLSANMRSRHAREQASA